jgi:type VI secretion system secreted protein VgrG
MNIQGGMDVYGFFPEALAKVARFNQDTRLVRVHAPLEGDPFVVHRLTGTESVSRPFSFTAELLSPDALLELKQLVGQPLRFSLQAGDGRDRHFHGYVSEFGRTGTDGGLARYHVEIAPWFAFLAHTSNCRIFQDRTVLEIVDEVFAPYAELADYRAEVDAGSYPRLKYCVQYNESDFAFVSRLLEDAGIHYRYEHAEDGHTMVLADDSTRCPRIEGPAQVSYLADDGVQNLQGLDRWSTRRRVRANAHSLKSFDFKQPRSALAVERPLGIPHGILPRLENYVYDGAARYGDSQVGDALAGLRAEENQWQAKLFESAGNHRRLQSGRSFVLHGHFEHTEADEEAREFLLLQVGHDIRNNFGDGFDEVEGASYRCTATCLRRKIPYRPQRVTPQPRMPGPQTATVVGPPGEEIHADRYGRVKVQFHWDRLGAFDEGSSCWVRVASPWAGSGMGGVSAPRIGQEVVVDFLDGNPDRPIITGRVYNEDNMPPFGLEVSGMKSRTVKGEGYNEVTMHDGDGRQLLNMHAQRDMATTVLNDQTNTVRNNQSTDVTSNQTTTVGVNQSISVGADRSLAVKGNETHATTGSRTKTVDGAETSTVTGAVTETFKAGQTRTITAAGYTETITGPYVTALTGDYSSTRTGNWKETVSGTSKRDVAGAATETLGAGRTVSITGDDIRGVAGNVEDSNQGNRTVSVDGDYEQGTSGSSSRFSTGEMSLGSAARMTAGVGESGIVIDRGSVTISAGGATIVVNAAGVSINGAKIDLNC